MHGRPEALRARSEIVCLMSRNVVIGAIAMYSEEKAAYSREDITILQTMVDNWRRLWYACGFYQSQTSLEESSVQQRYALKCGMVMSRSKTSSATRMT